MILVDSSVWIDFFRDKATVQTARLEKFLLTRRLATADLVLVEVLQGCRSEREARRVAGRMLLMEQLTVSDRNVALEAARLYRVLRGRGITVRKTIDTLVATRCIIDRLSLLYSDRDFDPFVEHCGLRSALDLVLE